MKKRFIIPIALILIMGIILVGCKKKTIIDEPEPDPVEETIVEVEEEEQQDILSKFYALIDEESEVEKVAAYINDNINKLNQLDGNRMIDALEKKMESSIDDYTDRILENDKDGELMKIAETEFYFPEDKVIEIKNNKLKEVVTKAFNNMYKLVNLEGNFYPIIDYSKLQKYNNNITDEWKEYLAIRAMDSESVPFVDGAMRITFAELSDRIIKIENFLNKYIDNDRHEVVVSLYENKLTAYMKGLPNSPIADWETNKILKEVLDSYNQTSNLDGYVTPTIIYKYLEVIKDKSFVIDKEVLREADILIAEAVDMMMEYK